VSRPTPSAPRGEPAEPTGEADERRDEPTEPADEGAELAERGPGSHAEKIDDEGTLREDDTAPGVDPDEADA
jgi:hypothetical protein